MPMGEPYPYNSPKLDDWPDKSILQELSETIEQLRAQIQERDAAIAELREALEWYADARHYRHIADGVDVDWKQVQADAGAKARTVLANPNPDQSLLVRLVAGDALYEAVESIMPNIARSFQWIVIERHLKAYEQARQRTVADVPGEEAKS